MSHIQLHPAWLALLQEEFNQDYMVQLKSFLQQEKKEGKIIYPPGSEIFAAFNATPPEKVKVLVLGQDPYHGPGQAHGFSFSVNDGIPFPPSLHNIFKELGNDLHLPYPKTGNLITWAKQGVLLLNATLTVRHGEAGSHQKKGWELFTDKVIEAINQQKNHVVFMLWGKYAIDKVPKIDPQRHCILTAPHPSPLSAHRGFLGCKHFSEANRYLQSKGYDPIQWAL
jgi:uracil-DNA glycosylase